MNGLISLMSVLMAVLSLLQQESQQDRHSNSTLLLLRSTGNFRLLKVTGAQLTAAIVQSEMTLRAVSSQSGILPQTADVSL